MKKSVMVFMSKHMMACDEASFLVSYNKDNRLGLANWMRLKMHLISCHLCRKYEAQIDELDSAVSEYRISAHNEPCHHHLSEKACNEMKQALEAGMNAN
jgi:hypothetical protein